ncbi:ABC transporter permease [Poritiphilus flavus]|uniref:Ribose ABC transporter permease n=1 Tax=Poritiphilus flavus TaxID=2697053 RepID=A0A6L9E7N9_9FLAO|nr:ABC transporter permease [Poritiphilus flavus]NAS10622.1 ribose ABC transporter permease [Poritiphilus flavus]
MQRLLDNSTMVLFALTVLFFSLLSPEFFSFNNFFNILVQGAALAILATGMTFVLLTAGIDLSVGSIMFLVGVISGKMVVSGLPLWFAGVIVLGIGLAFGFVNALFIFRLKVIPFIVTLATFYAGRGLGLLISDTRAINLPESLLKLGSGKIWGIPVPILLMLIVVFLAYFILTRTNFGKHVYAVGHDPEKSRKAGISVNRVLLKVYLICGFCAALGGLVAISQLGAISPTFGLQSEFMAIAAAILGGTSLFGGRGSVFPGTLIGVLLIQSIQNGLVMINADPYLHPLITGSIIFLIVMIDSLQNMRRKKAKKLGLN